MYTYIHTAALEAAGPTVFVVWLLAWVDVRLFSPYHACSPPPPLTRGAYVGRQAGLSLTTRLFVAGL